jgi:hypothetical protein
VTAHNLVHSSPTLAWQFGVRAVGTSH